MKPEDSCPVACGPGLKGCGLQRVNGRLVLGADGLPLPNCVSESEAAPECEQPNVTPSPLRFMGGSGSTNNGANFLTMPLNGTSGADMNTGVIGEIGSDAYADGPIFYAGNGTDATVAVQVKKCC